MKNNLLELRENIDTILEVRDKLLGDMDCLKYRDVDTENTGYWVKVPVLVNGEHKNAALGIYVNPGKGISVNFNSMQFYKKLPGTPSYDEVMDTIDEGMEEPGYELDT
jgi:hypothetical protein